VFDFGKDPQTGGVKEWYRERYASEIVERRRRPTVVDRLWHFEASIARVEMSAAHKLTLHDDSSTLPFARPSLLGGMVLQGAMAQARAGCGFTTLASSLDVRRARGEDDPVGGFGFTLDHRDSASNSHTERLVFHSSRHNPARSSWIKRLRRPALPFCSGDRIDIHLASRTIAMTTS